MKPSDPVTLLDQNTSAFAFLPVVNWFYLFWQNSSLSSVMWGVGITALIVSTVGYNLVTRVDYSKAVRSEDDEQAVDILSIRTTAVSIVTLLAWMLIFIWSLIALWGHSENATIWPELLILISVLFLTLILSDIILNEILSEYEDSS